MARLRALSVRAGTAGGILGGGRLTFGGGTVPSMDKKKMEDRGPKKAELSGGYYTWDHFPKTSLCDRDVRVCFDH